MIQGRGNATEGNRYESFGIRTESLTTNEIQQLQSALVRSVDAESFGVRNVSASFSREILTGAIVAMILSFLLISLYVSVRFEWRFAVPILRTIVNDGLIAIGIYSLTGREVTAATVAAFLTIIGYSIYDTMIIFDRVRENIPLMKRSTFAHITNVSLWETIPRSLVTTFLTLVPGGAVLLRRRDAQGLRLRDPDRHRRQRLRRSSSRRRSSSSSRSSGRSPARKRADLAGDEEASVGGFKTAPGSCARAGARDGPRSRTGPEAGARRGRGRRRRVDRTSASRERRRQRRGGRPHGRPR